MAKKDNLNAFSLIKDQYFRLDKNYDLLFKACKTEKDKLNLKRDYIIARSNYRKSLNLKFDKNDPIVVYLTADLSILEDRIKKDIKNLQKALNVLNMISESVRLASSIVVLVMSLV